MKTLIGNVPEHWGVVKLGSLCQINPGLPSGAVPDSDWHDDHRGTEGVPVVAAKNLQDGHISSTDLLTVSDTTARHLSRYRLTPGDIVCVRTGTLGRHALVQAEHDGWLFGTGCLRVRRTANAVQAVTSEYLAYYLAHPEVRNWIYRRASHMTVPSISARDLATLSVVMPPIETQHAIGDVLGALDHKIMIHRDISHMTTALRDALLPGLLAGEITA